MLQDLALSPASAIGAAVLRFVLADFWVAHCWFKIGYPGMSATQAFFAQQGLPAWLAWFVVSFEIVLAVSLVLGTYVSLLYLISLPILFASMWIYRRNGFYFSGAGVPFFWVCAQIAQARARRSSDSTSGMAAPAVNFVVRRFFGARYPNLRRPRFPDW